MRCVLLVYIFAAVVNLDLYFCFRNSECAIFSKTNAQIDRKLNGNGFHRTLDSSIKISSLEELSDCSILIKETFPSGAYVDPNQLMFMKDIDGPQFFVPQLVNVESPEHSSPEIPAYFFSELEKTSVGYWQGNISVPVHLRYHRSKHGSVETLNEIVSFSHPNIYLICNSEMSEACNSIAQLEPCPSRGIQQCDWLPISSFSTSDWLIATVPVGNADLSGIVLWITTSITCTATILLLIAMFKSPQVKQVSQSNSVS